MSTVLKREDRFIAVSSNKIDPGFSLINLAFMKMKKIIVLSLFCFTLVSCDFLNNGSPSRYYVSDEFKRFADFHIGSYWIYHNDSLSVSDTIRVVDYKRLFDYGSSDEDEFYDECIVIKYKSSYDSIYSHNNSIIIDNLNLNGFSRTRMIADTSCDEVRLYFLSKSSYIFDYIFNGVNHDTIYYTKNSNPYTYPQTVNQRSVEYYFSLDHGAIRKIYQDNSSRIDWYLVDYHIVR